MLGGLEDCVGARELFCLAWFKVVAQLVVSQKVAILLWPPLAPQACPALGAAGIAVSSAVTAPSQRSAEPL